jgi:hypothetical protein
MLQVRKSPKLSIYALWAGPRAIRITWPNIQMSLNFAQYSGYEKRKITRKVLTDKLDVIAFHSSEIAGQRRISDRVMEAIAEKIGRSQRESYPAHNFSSPKWKTLKRLGLFIIFF